MNLENQSTSDLKKLYEDLCALSEEIATTEVTAGNKEQVRDSILQRLHRLPLITPYDETDLQPNDDATVRAEIDQMAAKIEGLKSELESHLGESHLGLS